MLVIARVLREGKPGRAREKWRSEEGKGLDLKGLLVESLLSGDEKI